MKISDYNAHPNWNESLKLYDNKLEKEVIEDILFKDIEDDNTICNYAIVFGTSRIIEMKARIKTIFDLYKEKRMKKECLKVGIKEEDIIVDKEANNTLESLKNIRKYIDLKEEKSIILVTFAYHMRRCILGAIKYISPNIHYCPIIAETGYFEKDNYQNTTLGIQLANFDANHILRQAREGIIAESDDENYQKKK